MMSSTGGFGPLVMYFRINICTIITGSVRFVQSPVRICNWLIVYPEKYVIVVPVKGPIPVMILNIN